ncbi:MAG: ECF transporter S component [Ruminococcaceae bacterium]|nr:ECF transporter S component [Oscillospiraceae bacterium]
MDTEKRRMSTKTLVLGAVLTAMVVLLQMLGSFIHLGPFSISLVLIPIVIGAGTCGVGVATWLGLIFGIVVLASGDAAAFLTVDVFGTVVTVLAKGTLCGLLSGLAYKGILFLMNKRSARQIDGIRKLYGLCDDCEAGVLKALSRNNQYIAVLVAAVVCPLVNTGVFLIGCMVFFMDTVAAWGQAANFPNVGAYMIFGLVGWNFLFELAINIILSPVVVRLLNIRKKA